MAMRNVTREEIEKLTDEDVIAAKAKRGAKSTIEFVLTQVSINKTLEMAKKHLLTIYKHGT